MSLTKTLEDRAFVAHGERPDWELGFMSALFIPISIIFSS